jgi:DDE superfamily endonuclease
MEQKLDLYTDYLISSTGQTSATGLSRLLDNEISHDSITRFLSKSEFDSKTLWQAVKPLIRQHENASACLVFDDCIIEKAYTDENALMCWHWDHSKQRSVKGINLLSAFYVCQKDAANGADSEPIRLPVMFELILKTVFYYDEKKKKQCRKSAVTKNELMQTMISQCIHNQLIFKYILADSWFASTDNMHFINQKNKFFIFEIQDNRLCVLAEGQKDKPAKKSQWINIKSLNIADNTPTLVWFKDMNFPVLVTKQVFKNEDNEQVGVRFLVSNDLSLSHDDFVQLYKKRWSVEEYHKSLKQNACIAKSPTRTLKTQSNHIYCAIWAYVKLEKMKICLKLNHFEIKAKIYIKALKAAYQELNLIRESFVAA